MVNNIYKITYALALLFLTKCRRVNITNIQTNIDKIASVDNAAAEWEKYFSFHSIKLNITCSSK
jgi:hypothetical protein